MKAKLSSAGDLNSKNIAVEVGISNIYIAMVLANGTGLRRRASPEET
jgi:hypothetical protein